MRKIIRGLAGVLFGFSGLLCAVIGECSAKLPDNYYLCDTNTFKINALPVYASIDSDDIKLMGIIPIKNVIAEKIERPLLSPCGTPFGIKIMTEGAIVTETGEVEGEDGIFSPASDGGLKSGDIIIKVNGVDITRNSDISSAVQSDGQKTLVTYTRGGITRGALLTPVKSKKDGLFKIGLWVRDSSAGIGTMTYYDPATGGFGGLGHGVCDVDTGQILPLSRGEAVSVYITGLVKGYSGSPGELTGTFLSRVPIGVIRGNTESGVFGLMDSPPVIGEPIEMAYKQEVKIGPASILATVNGNAPEEYGIVIEKIDYNDKNKVKNMVIKITDRGLLNSAGGIVQGMSGSPIIQNNRIVGAVTHVFVSDPSRGYAIFAENMYRASLGVDLEADETVVLDAA